MLEESVSLQILLSPNNTFWYFSLLDLIVKHCSKSTHSTLKDRNRVKKTKKQNQQNIVQGMSGFWEYSARVESCLFRTNFTLTLKRWSPIKLLFKASLENLKYIKDLKIILSYFLWSENFYRGSVTFLFMIFRILCKSKIFFISNEFYSYSLLFEWQRII